MVVYRTLSDDKENLIVVIWDVLILMFKNWKNFIVHSSTLWKAYNVLKWTKPLCMGIQLVFWIILNFKIVHTSIYSPLGIIAENSHALKYTFTIACTLYIF